jgi:hypothetical protein
MDVEEARTGALAGRSAAGDAPERTSNKRTDVGALEVRIVTSAGVPIPHEPFLVMDRETPNPTVPVRRVTDERGTARVDALAPQRYFVRSAHGKGMYADVQAGDVAIVEMRIDEGIDVTGVVVDDQGTPAPGAEIWVDTEGTRSFGLFLVAHADARGRFHIDDLWAVGIGARAEGYAPSPTRRFWGARHGSREEITLTLGATGAGVRGRVVDATGSPVGGALVLIGAWWGSARELPDGTQGEDALPVLLVTGDDGSFASEGLASGRTHVTIRARGHGAVRVVRDVGSTSGDEWTFVLPAERVLEGVVVNALGRVAPDANVSTSTHWDPLWSWHARTDVEGRFRLDGLGHDALSLSVAHASMGESGLTVPRGPGAPVEAVVTLTTRQHIRVVLIDEDGVPLAERSVGVRILGDMTPRTRATTDANGRAILGVSAGGEYEVVVTHPEGDAFHWAVVRRGVRVGDAEVVITMRESDRPVSRIVGRIALPGDQPMPADARAWIRRTQDEAGLNLDLDITTGRFESPRLLPGTYEVTLRAAGWGSVPLARVPVEREPVVDVGTLTLELPGSLAVEVRGASDAMSNGIGLRAENERGSVFARAEGRDGIVHFHQLAPGRYDVVLEGADWLTPPTGSAHTQVEVVSGQKTRAVLHVEVGHVRGLRVEGLTDQDAGLVVEVRTSKENAVLARRVFRGVPSDLSWNANVTLVPGSYVVEAVHPDGRRASATFDVSGSDEPDVVVRFER